MKKSKSYEDVRFSADVIKQALKAFTELCDPKEKDKAPSILTVDVDGETWDHDSLDEFCADYRRSKGNSMVYRTAAGVRSSLSVAVFSDYTSVEVAASDRATINSIFEVFESKVEESRKEPPPTPEPPQPSVFIGHGRSAAWRDLKDHLHDKHGYEVIAYETGARGGHAIRDVLEDMLSRSSFALLALTAEDETADGKLRARQNVVHEVGLFQGRLGFSRAVVMLEEGVEEFSNIKGIEQIRFSSGNIKETFGEILAILRREFD